jgi:hypothetical protein
LIYPASSRHEGCDAQFNELLTHAARLRGLLDAARKQPGAAVDMAWEMDSRNAVRDFDRFIAEP